MTGNKNTISLPLSDEPEDQFSPMLSVYKRRRKILKIGYEENNHEERRRGDFCLPLDLIVEILKRLPTKSLVRFRSVSKQWSTIIGSRRDFIDSIVTRSLRHPPQKLPVFIFHHSVPETFFTVFTESTKHAVTIPRPSRPISFQYTYARGLICCSSDQSHLVTIYNPTTRQLFPLPEIEAPVGPRIGSFCHFGYDPVMNQYKVLFMIIDFHDWKQTYHVFTLGQRQFWRKIKGFDETLIPCVNSVCIDGNIYYGATRRRSKRETVLLSFDIRSEIFDHVWAPETLLEALSTALRPHPTLVNYLGKLGWICCNSIDMSIWIMDNAGKQEWSRTILCLPTDPLSLLGNDYVIGFSGATPNGEIFATQWLYYFDKSLYVYYYDINQNSFRRVQVEGGVSDKTKKHCNWVRVIAIHDHVENTMWL